MVTPPPPPIRLFRFFALASVVSISLVTAVVGWIFAGAASRDAIAQGRDFAALVAAHIEARIAHAGLGHLLEPSSGTLTAADAAALDEAIRPAVAGLRVLRVNMFDPDGRFLYSTWPRTDEPRPRRRAGPELLLALSGEPSAKLTDRMSHERGVERSPFALEAYIPVRDSSGRVVRVVEVYQDAQDMIAGIRTAAFRVAAVSFGSMAAMVLALFAVFRRGDRAIRERTAALADANAALADLTRRLEGEVRARTSELVAQERLANLGTVAAGLAHEVNNPLASISSAAEALLRRCEKEHGGVADPGVAEYLGIIRDEAFRAKAITRDLLDFARAEGGNDEESIDVNELVRSVAALLKLRPRRAGVELRLELAPDGLLPRVRGRATKLRQAIFNVTDNALDALPERGGTVVWSTAREQTPVGADALALRCRDDGAGLTAEERARVFEPFYTTKEPGRGTGLGLSISWGIVEAHGGTIAIESEGPGRGATVTILLPIAPPDAAHGSGA